MNKLKKFLFKIFKIIVVTSLIIFCIYLYCDYQTYGYRKFHKELWDKNKELVEAGPTQLSDRSSNVISYRCGMYNELVKNHLKKGMGIEEVIKMLGKTDLKDYCIDKKVKCIEYHLGTCVDFTVLLEGRSDIYLCFDGNNQYISAGLSRYPQEICGGGDKVIGCFKNECWEPPIVEEDGRVREQNNIDYEQW